MQPTVLIMFTMVRSPDAFLVIRSSENKGVKPEIIVRTIQIFISGTVY